MTDTELWFTRATLKREAPDIAPLINRLFPDGQEGETLNATHQLLWTLMPEDMQKQGKPARSDGQAKAAFLWRQAERDNSWYILGPEPRRDCPFFTVETKPYVLSLQVGERLSFDLIANATVNRMVDPAKGRKGRQRCDVVMDALKAHERAVGHRKDRAVQRKLLTGEVLQNWLTQQGEHNGFSVHAFDTVSYRTVDLSRPGLRRDRSKAGEPSVYGIAHMRGLITVTDPMAFIPKVQGGFGRAKAFGCGLMLLRRVE